jgi:predicted RNase H-like nuclease (RuvC/YqgF family)
LPSLESAVRNLEYENRELRRSFDGHHHHHHGSRDMDDAMRKLRNKNTKLRNDNETLVARVRGLEREIREGVGDRARRLMEEINAWRRRHENMGTKLDYVTARNKILESHNEYLVQQEMKYKSEVARLDAILRHHGLSAQR